MPPQAHLPLDEIARLSNALDAARGASDPDRRAEDLLRLAELRLEVGRKMVDTARDEPALVATADHFPHERGIPEIGRQDLDVTAVASGLSFHGSLIVRELFAPHEVELLRSHLESSPPEPVAPDGRGRFPSVTPAALADLLAIYRKGGWGELAREYLGGWPVMNVNRIDVKREPRSFGLPWHQDGAYFRGPVQALNVWAALTDVGVDRPSLGIVPRRFTEVLGFGVAGPDLHSEQPSLNYLSAQTALLEEILEGAPEVTPHLEPGDALVFDELTLHRTAAVEWGAPYRDLARTWFFAPSRYPATGAPMAL